MSLFGSIRMAGNSLRASEIALQVVGQNIANADTPGYIREEVVFSPAPTQKKGSLLLGLGVQVEAVVQKIDYYLEGRLRGAVSDLASAESREEAYTRLEGVIGELTDTDLSTSLDNFFSSINEILNQPENVSVRNLAVLQGQTLAADINRMADRVMALRADVNERVEGLAGDINRLVEEVRSLNIQIAQMEGGNTSASDAVGLRDRRLEALEDLAQLVDIRVSEQESGGVTVYSGGDFLVFEGIARQVEVVLDTDRGLTVADLQIVETGSLLNPTSGEVYGLLTARDDVLGSFLDELDSFAATLAFEFNRVFSSGQGLSGYTAVTGGYEVDDATEPLNQAGLKFTPQSGSFQLLVHNNNTGLVQTTDVSIDLGGHESDTTLADLATALDEIDGISAQTTGGVLRIESESADQQFAFADDSSGVLAALGINTFFTGSTALDLGVNSAVADDPAKFAASLDGIGAGTGNLIEGADANPRLAGFLDRELDSRGGASLSFLYDRMVSQTTQGATVARAVAEGARVFELSLRGQKLALSGVNLDEEAVRLIAFQKSFQASAKYIATLNELFDILVSF